MHVARSNLFRQDRRSYAAQEPVVDPEDVRDLGALGLLEETADPVQDEPGQNDPVVSDLPKEQ
jgi:hypothetical protein